MNLITAENLKKDLESNKEIILINALDKEYFNDCHISGSINIPAKSNMQTNFQDWDQDTYIVVYCASSECPASKEASKKLIDMGFLNVFIYEGGIQEWKAKGYKTEGACSMSYLKAKGSSCCQGKCDGNCKGKCSCKSSACDCNGKSANNCKTCKGKCMCMGKKGSDCTCKGKCVC